MKTPLLKPIALIAALCAFACATKSEMPITQNAPPLEPIEDIYQLMAGAPVLDDAPKGNIFDQTPAWATIDPINQTYIPNQNVYAIYTTKTPTIFYKLMILSFKVKTQEVALTTSIKFIVSRCNFKNVCDEKPTILGSEIALGDYAYFDLTAFDFKGIKEFHNYKLTEKEAQTSQEWTIAFRAHLRPIKNQLFETFPTIILNQSPYARHRKSGFAVRAAILRAPKGLHSNNEIFTQYKTEPSYVKPTPIPAYRALGPDEEKEFALILQNEKDWGEKTENEMWKQNLRETQFNLCRDKTNLYRFIQQTQALAEEATEKLQYQNQINPISAQNTEKTSEDMINENKAPEKTSEDMINENKAPEKTSEDMINENKAIIAQNGGDNVLAYFNALKLPTTPIAFQKQADSSNLLDFDLWTRYTFNEERRDAVQGTQYFWLIPDHRDLNRNFLFEIKWPGEVDFKKDVQVFVSTQSYPKDYSTWDITEGYLHSLTRHPGETEEQCYDLPRLNLKKCSGSNWDIKVQTNGRTSIYGTKISTKNGAIGPFILAN